MKAAVKNLTKTGQYRNLCLTLNAELFALYTDTDGNFVFNNTYLDETELPTRKPSNPDGATDKVLENLVKRISSLSDASHTTIDFDLSKIEKKFNVKAFTGKEKASDWLDTFLTECSRFKISSDEQKVACLRVFMKSGAEEWYRSAEMKLEPDQWESWSESFLAVFGDKSWSKVVHAYNYKYLSGSLVDYALRKERLILEIEKGMTDTSRINLIVVGLPTEIRDKLDREQLKTTDQLLNRLGRYENVGQHKKDFLRDEKTVNPKSYPPKLIEKKPCGVCESRKLYNRFHPEEKCFFKNRSNPRDKPYPKREINMNESVASDDNHATDYSVEHEKNE